ncbi:MAG: hypothetical protein ABSE44_17065 [Candidatus Sulfotelmatobacter sp.]|jgi:hypothetical protein
MTPQARDEWGYVATSAFARPAKRSEASRDHSRRSGQAQSPLANALHYNWFLASKVW